MEEKKMDNNKEVKLVTDGGCRGNPGLGAIGFILFDLKNRVIAKGGKRIGYTTNNKAEYLALIEGLENTARYTKGIVHCYLDSELVVKQVKGEWKIKDEDLKKLFFKVLDKVSMFKEVNYVQSFIECSYFRNELHAKVLTFIANSLLSKSNQAEGGVVKVEIVINGSWSRF
jgi:ribonuclease HI